MNEHGGGNPSSHEQTEAEAQNSQEQTEAPLTHQPRVERSPFYRRLPWVKPVVSRENPHPPEQLEREKNYTKNEEIEALIQTVRDGTWQAGDRGRRLKERYGDGRFGKFKEMMAGELDSEVVTRKTKTPDGLGGHVSDRTEHFIERHYGTETGRKLGNIAFKTGTTAATMGILSILTGWGAPVGVALLGSAVARGGAEIAKSVIGKERHMREELLIARQRLYDKAVELADRIPSLSAEPQQVDSQNPTHDEVVAQANRRQEVQMWHEKRNQAVIDLDNFVKSSEQNTVKFVRDDEGMVLADTHRFGDNQAESYVAHEARDGGRVGPTLNRGTEVYQPSEHAPGKTIGQMEKDLESYRRKWEWIEEGLAALGGIAGGVTSALMMKVQLMEAKVHALETGKKVVLDIDGNKVSHAVHFLHAAHGSIVEQSQKLVFDYNNMIEAMKASIAGAHGEGMTHAVFTKVTETAGSVATQVLNAVENAVNGELIRMMAGASGALLARFGYRVATSEAQHRRFRTNQNTLSEEQEVERRRLQPDAAPTAKTLMEGLRDLAAENNKEMPAAGQHWSLMGANDVPDVRHNEDGTVVRDRSGKPDYKRDDAGNIVKINVPYYINVEIVAVGEGPYEGKVKVKLAETDDYGYQRVRIEYMPIIDLIRGYELVEAPPTPVRVNPASSTTPGTVNGGTGGTGGTEGGRTGGGGDGGAGAESDAGDTGGGGGGAGGTSGPASGGSGRTEHRDRRETNKDTSDKTSGGSATETETTDTEKNAGIAVANELAGLAPKPEKEFDVHIETNKDGTKFVADRFVWSEDKYKVSVIVLGLSKINPNELDKTELQSDLIVQYIKQKKSFLDGNGPDARLKLRVKKAGDPRGEPCVLAEAVEVVTVAGGSARRTSVMSHGIWDDSGGEGGKPATLNNLNMGSEGNDADDTEKRPRSRHDHIIGVGEADKIDEEYRNSRTETGGKPERVDVTFEPEINDGTIIEVPSNYIHIKTSYKTNDRGNRIDSSRTISYGLRLFSINGIKATMTPEHLGGTYTQASLKRLFEGDNETFPIRVVKVNRDAQDRVIKYQCEVDSSEAPERPDTSNELEAKMSDLTREKPVKAFNLDIGGDGTDANPYEYDQNLRWGDEVQVPVRLRFFLNSTEEYERRQSAGQDMRGFSETMTLVDEYVKRKAKGENVQLKLRAIKSRSDRVGPVLMVNVEDLLVDGIPVSKTGETNRITQERNRDRLPEFTFADKDPMRAGAEFDLDFPDRVPVWLVNKKNPETHKVTEKFVPPSVMINRKKGRSVNISTPDAQNYIENDLAYMRVMSIRTQPLLANDPLRAQGYDFVYALRMDKTSVFNPRTLEPTPGVPDEPTSPTEPIGEPEGLGGESVAISTEKLLPRTATAKLQAEYIQPMQGRVIGKHLVRYGAERAQLLAAGMLAHQFDEAGMDHEQSTEAALRIVNGNRPIVDQAQQLLALRKEDKIVESTGKLARTIAEIAGPDIARFKSERPEAVTNPVETNEATSAIEAESGAEVPNENVQVPIRRNIDLSDVQ